MLITLTSNVFLSPKPRKRTEFYSIMTPPTWWKAKTGGAWRHLTILACLGGETSRKLQVTVRGWWHMQVCNAEDSFGRKHQFQDFVSFGYDSLFLSSCQLWSYAVIPISSCDTCRDFFFFFFVFLICQDILGEASWTVSSRLQASGFSLRHMQVGTVFGCGWGCWIVGYVSQIGMGRRPKSSGFVYLQTHSCPWKIIQTALLLFSCVIIWGQRVDYWLPFKNKLYESERSSSGLCGSLLLHAFYFCVSINNLHIIFI